ncbi:MAG: metallophosphoesterase [Thermodesulfobacteriota bacterium]
MNKRLIPLLLLLIFALTSCQVGPSTGKELAAADWYVPDETLTVWALSDTHIKYEGSTKPFRNAVADINENVPDVDMAFNAGDVVHFPREVSYDLYIEAREKSYIREWHEIIGNHDYKTDKGQIFQAKLKEKPHYTVEKGNILFIFMSNEDRGKATVISDETFEWWKDLVINNQDKIIVTVTHAPLKGSGITFSGLKARQITDSKRFREVLREYKVDLWFSGHLHMPQELFGMIVKQKKLNGTVFIEISSIRPDLGGIKEPQSRVLTFACGSDKMLVRSRNHERRFFTPGLDKVITLSKPYECD